uniref:Uncharacterized protein n=1 Tax=Escherichia coli TaxID=562 RepID=A0A7U1E1Y9_ECOLX|nr:hypothetical protein [Escherichia coli]
MTDELIFNVVRFVNEFSYYRMVLIGGTAEFGKNRTLS